MIVRKLTPRKPKGWQNESPNGSDRSNGEEAKSNAELAQEHGIPEQTMRRASRVLSAAEEGRLPSKRPIGSLTAKLR